MALVLLALALQASAPLYVRGLLTPFPHSGIGSDFASWQTMPTIGDMHSAYPSGLKGRLESWLNCDLANDGRLKRCTVSAQYPDDPKLKPAMLKLVRKLRAKPDYVAVAHEQNAKVWVDLIMTPAEDDNAGFTGSLCPSPFCTPVPPPPPPPPPQLTTRPVAKETPSATQDHLSWTPRRSGSPRSILVSANATGFGKPPAFSNLDPNWEGTAVPIAVPLQGGRADGPAVE